MKVILPSDNSKQPILFYKKIPGKWILAGEHTVLRGGDAIVFPLNSQFLEIFYFKKNSPFELVLEGINSSEIRDVVESVFTKAFQKLKVEQNQISGQVRLKSNILFGAGMGASATLCVAVTEFFHFFGYIETSDMYEFARDLENMFHGESSGVDIAVVLRRKPLLFSREKGSHELLNTNLPKLYLSHTGEKGITKDCVQKVKELWIQNPSLAKSIDEKMKIAVSEFLVLLNSTKSEGWVPSMQLAHSCFCDWGLVSEQVQTHENILMAHGAQAVKLTGSGAGGFMLSLWNRLPQNLPFPMIACFEN